MTKFQLLKYSFAICAVTGSLSVGCKYLLTKQLGRLSRLILLAVGIGLYGFLHIYVVEPNWIEVHKVILHDRKLAPLLENTKIVHITDFHLTDGLGFREHQLIRKVNALKPDLIFVTGDFIDNLTQLGPARKLIQSLKARQGIYGVPGNTDYTVMDSGSLERELEPAGIDILINENRKIYLDNGNVLWLVGVDDPKYEHANIERALGGISESVPVLMLAHAPEIFKEAVRLGVQIVLVGDTHGGQVGIPFLIHMSRYANRTPYMSGIFSEGKTKMYVNRGIGTKTLPIRFLCPPEIAVIEVKP